MFVCRILGARVAELDQKLKTLEMTGFWNITGTGCEVTVFYVILTFLLSLYVSVVSFSVLYCIFFCPTWQINVFNTLSM